MQRIGEARSSRLLGGVPVIPDDMDYLTWCGGAGKPVPAMGRPLGRNWD
jgi:hypothetical protein